MSRKLGSSITIEHYELNPKVDAAMFAMPAAAPVEKPETKKQ